MTELKLFVASLLTKRKAFDAVEVQPVPPAVSGILAALLLVSESARLLGKNWTRGAGAGP